MVKVVRGQYHTFVENGLHVRLSEPLHQVVFCVGLQTLHRLGGKTYIRLYVILRYFAHVEVERYWCKGEVGRFLGEGRGGECEVREDGSGIKGESEEVKDQSAWWHEV